MRRRLSLFFLLLLSSLAAARITPADYLQVIGQSVHWEQHETVQQPRRPLNRRYGKHVISMFFWSTNVTEMREMNDGNITIGMNNYDLGIMCKLDRTPVVVRLVPAANADDCSFDGGVVAVCPDLEKIPMLYADVHGPGDYVLTTFSDGTLAGRNATRGGLCKKGVKVPIKIVSLPRDPSLFHPEKSVPLIQLPPRPPPEEPSSAITTPIVTAIALTLMLHW